MDFLHFRQPVSAGTHAAWMLLAVPGCLFLWRLSRGDRPKQLCLLVFGFSLVACYGGSALYHTVPEHQSALCETLDHIGIYCLIAGSYTPVAFTLLQGRWRWGSLAAVWLLASFGIVLRSLFWDLPAWLYTGLYLGLGWSVVVSYFELARVVSHRALRPVLAGGLFYSSGALINLAQWPRLWEPVFGPHEVFHLLVMAGSVSHFVFMVQWVVPFDRRAGVTFARCAAAQAALDDSLESGPLGGRGLSLGGP